MNKWFVRLRRKHYYVYGGHFILGPFSETDAKELEKELNAGHIARIRERTKQCATTSSL